MRNTDSKKWNELGRIYQYKLRLAETDYSKQKEVVETSRSALKEVTDVIDQLSNEVASNNTFMQNKDVSTNPDKIVRALRYREQLEYDLERQNFYKHMAEEELETQLQALTVCISAITKLQAKIRNVNRIGKTLRTALLVKEDNQEDENTTLVRPNQSLKAY